MPPPLNPLPGIAVVTGAASGIGQATARAFFEGGCHAVVLIDVNKEGLQSTIDSLPTSIESGSATYFVCDVSSEEAVDTTFHQIAEKFGRVDYLANCAGILGVAKITDCSLADFDKIQSVNLRGSWMVNRAALRIMQSQSLDAEHYPDANIPPHRAQRGSIINISSVAAAVAFPMMSAYTTSKAGVVGITKSNAIDYAALKIRVNAIMPGVIHTPMAFSSPAFAKSNEEVVAKKWTPLQRYAEPEEVADVIVFLAGTRASFVSGVVYEVDGGMLGGRSS